MEDLIKKFKKFNIDIDENKNYIYYEEILNKKGKKYDEIINNKLNLDNYSSYSPSCKNLFNVIKELDIRDSDSILDIGSGKGFALFVFSLFNFSNISGIEININDYEICKNNIKNLNLENKINIINQNVLEFNDFINYNYFYFYNPFNKDIFLNIIIKLKILDNITIIYKNIHEEEIKILLSNNFLLKKKIIGEERDYYIFKN